MSNLKDVQPKAMTFLRSKIFGERFSETLPFQPTTPVSITLSATSRAPA